MVGGILGSTYQLVLCSSCTGVTVMVLSGIVNIWEWLVRNGPSPPSYSIFTSLTLMKRAPSLALAANAATHSNIVHRVNTAPLRRIEFPSVGREPRKKCLLRCPANPYVRVILY